MKMSLLRYVALGVFLGVLGLISWHGLTTPLALRSSQPQPDDQLLLANLHLERVDVHAPPTLGFSAALLSCGDDGVARCADDDAGVPTVSPRRDSLARIIEHAGVDPTAHDVLLVVFSPLDCPMCLREAEIWNELHVELAAAGGRFQVVAVVDQSTQDEVAQIASALELGFPIYLDRESTVRAVLNVAETPYKVLVDSRGQVLLQDPPNRSAAQQVAFGETVRRLVGSSSRSE